ncbi:MAG: sulfite exporter TauE/SafE family protein [Bacteroidetes bacterium]|nr:sulfite exporter TauE/SafE family protein [Bacteroidota bacterium]
MFDLLQDNWLIAPIFFGIAFLYAMAGFGGGSSYLAIMSLFGVDFNLMRLAAYFCNISVVSGNLINYIKEQLLPFKLAFPLVAISIPAAFVGGLIELTERSFFIILGGALIIAAALLFKQTFNQKIRQAKKFPKAVYLVIGAAVGYVSGLVGIGGGIFLAPIMHLMRLASAKKIAAIASFYILVNSVAGLSGRIISEGIPVGTMSILPLVALTILGGQLGNKLSIKKLNPVALKRLTAILIFYVGIRVLNQQLHVI